jgi:hypothetical protein
MHRASPAVAGCQAGLDPPPIIQRKVEDIEGAFELVSLWRAAALSR